MTDQPKDTRLWCLHHIGADEVHPAPDFSTAQTWADWANKQFSEHADISRFVVAVWPHSAERHAAWLIKALDEWTLPEQPVYAKREARVACPFCGGEAATEVDDEDFDVARGICKDCGACGPFVDLSDYPTTAAARDAAGTAWDTRAAPATTLETIGSHFGNGGGFDPGAGGEAA